MQQGQSKKIPQKGQVKIEFSPKLITSWGGTAALFSRFFDKIGFRELVEKIFPVQEFSNNSTGVYSKLISLFISVLNGGTKFSHINYMENGIKIYERCFSVKRLVKSSTGITRYWNKYDRRALTETLLQNIVIYFLRPLLEYANIESDTLRFDSTVITRFGKQQGAKKGYNPAKRGRPSIHPQLAFLGSGYTVNFWNRPGNTRSANGIVEFYNQTRDFIRGIMIERVLADSGYYDRNFIIKLEEDNVEYVIAVPIHQFFQRIIYQLCDWTRIDQGIEVNEFKFSHQCESWGGERRYVVVRQEIRRRPKATGKQLSLFKDEDYGKEYRHSLYITNNETASPYEIWRYYRPRANVENIIENLKDGFGLSAYNMNGFWATEAVLMTICLILHNLVTLLIKQVLHPGEKERKLRTMRMEYLVIPALLGKDGRDDVLRLGLSSPKRQTKFTEALARLSDMKLLFYCNAVAFGEVI
ncbi:MAG: transposase [Candidatus Cloacimonadaceae bacterium]|nr:transposase [Candidatus Cloacimonadaceae bacterium]